MTEPLKIKVEFDGENAKALLNFISETRDGKYTSEKPDLTQITYKRLEIPEQNHSYPFDDGGEEILLFGIS